MNQAYRKMTPESEPLCAVFPKFFKKNEKLVVKKLAGDASKREYFRVSQNEKNFILQTDDAFSAETQSQHPFIAGQAILNAVGLPVPKIFATLPDSGWILMEDLGDLFLQKEPRDDLYKRALEHLGVLALKASREQVSAKDSRLAKAPHWDWAFDEKKLGDEMQHTQTFLIEQYCQLPGSHFQKLLTPICQKLAARPRFFCHRDYHSRNLMVTPEELFIIDFQDARMGPLSYDLVSLVWDPYVTLSSSQKNSYVKFWKGLYPAKLLGDALDEEIHLMKVQRLLKAAGSYASFVFKKNTREYLPYLEPALLEARTSCEDLGLKEVVKLVDDILEKHSVEGASDV
jgi:aminoglycoside/choline kinase family phosphotransferase